MRWRIIPNWGGRYEVSDAGQVRSVGIAVGGRWPGFKAVRKGRVLKAVVKSNGYHCVTLTRADGTREQIAIHRLVLLVFKGVTTNRRLHCCHWDNDKSNNRLGNLRADTVKSNLDDQRRHGVLRRGETHGMAVLTERQARRIKSALTTAEAVGLAVRFGVGKYQAYAIRSGRCWKHLE